MADQTRSVSVRLRAEVAQFRADMAAAAKASQDAAAKVESHWSKSEGVFGKTANTIKQNSSALTSVGVTATAASAAVLGVGAAAMKTGVSYNTLQQTARAAMSTLLGGATAANAQMDRLDEWAVNSPFAKQVFIEAQQQMIGFGVEADKVLPTLDAIQDTVAAFGGSNEHIASLVEILSQVQSQGRLSGRELQRMGYYGVDAAAIIGAQMGKSGAEIREMASRPGGIPVEQIWDPLVDGLTERFGGAAENVKDTHEGAIDRIKAAWRDLSGELARPLVDPNGGGFGADVLNFAADAMRLFMELPEPIRNTALGIVGLGAAGVGAVGATAALVPRMIDLHTNMVQLSTQFPRTARGLRNVGIAAGVVTGAIIAMQAAGHTVFRRGGFDGVEEMEQGMIRAAAGGRDLTEALGGVEAVWGDSSRWLGHQEIDDFGAAIDRVVNGRWHDGFNMWVHSWTGWGSEIADTTQTLETADQALARFVASGNFRAAANNFRLMADEAEANGISIEETASVYPEYINALRDTATQLGVTVSDAQLFAWAMGDIPPHVQAAIDAEEEHSAALDGMASSTDSVVMSTRDLLDALWELSGVFISAEEATIRYEEQLDKVRDAIEDNGAAWDVTTEKGRSNREELIKLAQAAQDSAEASARMGASQQDVQDDLISTYDVLVDSARQMGATAEEAEEYARSLMGIPDNVETEIWARDNATAIIEAVKEELVNLPDIREVWIRVNETWVREEGGQRQYRSNPHTGMAAMYSGGIVEFMDRGGMRPMSPVAQMVPPNTWRIVGDRPDVDEAYIPLDGSRRSKEILAEAIARMPGAFPMASGGIVAAAQARLDQAQRALEDITRANRSVTPEERRREQAQIRVDRAREALDSARAEQERRERLNVLRTDLRTDLRRGTIQDQVTRDLGGGYAAVDRLFGLGQNDDLSRSAQNRAMSSARRFEADLRRLYQQAEALDERLRDAQERAEELRGIQQSVTSGLLNERRLDFGDYSRYEGGEWVTDGGIQGATRRLSVDGSKLRDFAKKLQSLAALGLPGALVQEIAGMGVEAGSLAADEFLTASQADVSAYISAYEDYEKHATAAGRYVTNAFYDGGVDAADGVVRGLESQQERVERQIADLARSIENTFKQVLGIRSPSRVMAELGGYAGHGLALGLAGSIADVAAASNLLADAVVPDLQVGAISVSTGDAAEATEMVTGMSDVTLTAMAEMRQAVNEAYAEMGFTTLDGLRGMSSAQSSEQDAMKAGNLATWQAINADTAAHHETLKTTSATGFQSVKDTAALRLTEMRSGTDSTMRALRDDYTAHMQGLRRTSGEGFAEIERVGRESFSGLRSGMNAQMGEARPELVNSLNRLIDVFGRFTTSVNEAFGDVGVNLEAPAQIRMATGGVLPGHTPGMDVHHFRSRTAGDLYLSGGEAIMRPEWTQMVGGEATVRAMNDAARRGDHEVVHQMLHFAGGGVMPALDGVNAFRDSGIWRPWWALVRENFPNARLHSAYRPGSITATGNPSHHGAGRAIDITPSMAIFNWLAANYGPQTRELIFSPANNRQLHRGRPHMYTGVTRNMHWDHIHLAAMQPPMGAGAVPAGPMGVWDGMPVSHPFLDRAGVSAGADLEESYRRAANSLMRDIIREHSAQLGDNSVMRALGTGVMEATKAGLVEKAAEYGKTASMSFGNVADGPARQMAREMAESIGWGEFWPDIDWLVQRESSWNPTAQNPTSTAFGLFQFLNGTWGPYGPKTADPRKQIEYGYQYIRDRYGDPAAARRFHERNNWYADGTRSARDGWAVVGEDGPELVRLPGGTEVRSNAQSRAMLAANRTFIPNGGGVDVEAIARAVAQEMAKHPQVVQHIDGSSYEAQRIAGEAVDRIAQTQALYGGGFR
ncbi:aggregation-promoting factor C-terminal-like domain-containing protein [Sediminivirga luteola]|uniref:Tape measure domain-containing protein n=1 Tax=Sediminivirga luteola TaxID=1774748 RepID=A0A8J2TXB8_9MICO|nr:tape measure protein [Sediminivirga luteola]GGA10630.1 hypothetical protein GCM10011333_11790 [Sediminivirga luteola]